MPNQEIEDKVPNCVFEVLINDIGTIHTFQIYTATTGSLRGRRLVKYLTDGVRFKAFAFLGINATAPVWTRFRPENTPGSYIDACKQALKAFVRDYWSTDQPLDMYIWKCFDGEGYWEGRRLEARVTKLLCKECNIRIYSGMTCDRHTERPQEPTGGVQVPAPAPARQERPFRRVSGQASNGVRPRRAAWELPRSQIDRGHIQ